MLRLLEHWRSSVQVLGRVIIHWGMFWWSFDWVRLLTVLTDQLDWIGILLIVDFDFLLHLSWILLNSYLVLHVHDEGNILVKSFQLAIVLLEARDQKLLLRLAKRVGYPLNLSLLGLLEMVGIQVLDLDLLFKNLLQIFSSMQLCSDELLLTNG